MLISRSLPAYRFLYLLVTASLVMILRHPAESAQRVEVHMLLGQKTRWVVNQRVREGKFGQSSGHEELAHRMRQFPFGFPTVAMKQVYHRLGDMSCAMTWGHQSARGVWALMRRRCITGLD